MTAVISSLNASLSLEKQQKPQVHAALRFHLEHKLHPLLSNTLTRLADGFGHGELPYQKHSWIHPK